jgi:hypothetical protein
MPDVWWGADVRASGATEVLSGVWGHAGVRAPTESVRVLGLRGQPGVRVVSRADRAEARHGMRAMPGGEGMGGVDEGQGHGSIKRDRGQVRGMPRRSRGVSIADLCAPLLLFSLCSRTNAFSQFFISDERMEDALNVGSKLKLVCDDESSAADANLPTCHSILNPLAKRKGVVQFVAEGVALRHADVIDTDPRRWAGLYFTGATASECVTGGMTRQCVRRKRCSLKQWFTGWHPTDMAKGAMVAGYTITLTEQLGGKQYVATTTACAMCVPDACRDVDLVCPNGRLVGSDPSLQPPGPISQRRDANGIPLRFTKPLCPLSCPVGTWLTCKDEAECWYVAPSAETVRIVKGNARRTLGENDAEIRKWVQMNRMAKTDVPVSLGLGIPIDECYPCHLAANLEHFGRRITTDGALMSQGYLQFECPGGADGPRPCRENEVSRSAATLNETQQTCQCKPGMFRDAQGGCQPCKAGFFCPFARPGSSGGMEACPVDTFSTGGSTACTACGRETGRCAAHQALTRCSGAAFQTRDSRCVDCEECMEVSGTLVAGTKPCLHVV